MPKAPGSFKPNWVGKQSNGRSNPNKEFYQSHAWKSRSARFKEQNPLCIQCLEEDNRAVPSEVTDHKIPINSKKVNPWDESNWQPLCKRHHDQKNGRESLK